MSTLINIQYIYFETLSGSKVHLQTLDFDVSATFQKAIRLL